MVGADDIDDGYKPVDRLGVAGGGLAAAEINRVRAFLQSVTLTFSPEDPDNAQAHRSERLRLDALAAASDLDWLGGLEAGRVDRDRAHRGLPLLGVGVTRDPHDGWSASLQRQAAYETGFGPVTSRGAPQPPPTAGRTI